MMNIVKYILLSLFCLLLISCDTKSQPTQDFAIFGAPPMEFGPYTLELIPSPPRMVYDKRECSCSWEHAQWRGVDLLCFKNHLIVNDYDFGLLMKNDKIAYYRNGTVAVNGQQRTPKMVDPALKREIGISDRPYARMGHYWISMGSKGDAVQTNRLSEEVNPADTGEGKWEAVCGQDHLILDGDALTVNGVPYGRVERNSCIALIDGHVYVSCEEIFPNK